MVYFHLKQKPEAAIERTNERTQPEDQLHSFVNPILPWTLNNEQQTCATHFDTRNAYITVAVQ